MRGGDYFSKSPNELNFFPSLVNFSKSSVPVYSLPTNKRQAGTLARAQSVFTDCESPADFFSLYLCVDFKQQRD